QRKADRGARQPLHQGVLRIVLERDRGRQPDREHQPAERVARPLLQDDEPDDGEGQDDEGEEVVALVVRGAVERDAHRRADRVQAGDRPRQAPQPYVGDPHPLTARIRKTSPGSSGPLTERAPIDSASVTEAAATVLAAATISPPAASDCSRCATLT